MALGLLAGCHEHVKPQANAAQDFLKRVDLLYDAYLGGNQEEAKQSLNEAIQLAKDADLPLNDKAHSLTMNYQRLYVLERRAGHKSLAEAALVRARYWLLEEAESGNNTTQDADEFVMSKTGDVIMDFVDAWDKKATGGKGPRYLVNQH
jgi:hypothetical protein